MKKMLSLAAMLAVLSYASPASAELKLTGDAAVRARGHFGSTESADGITKDKEDDLYFQYKVRLKAAADLGNGYFFKALVQSEEAPVVGGVTANVAGGWSYVGTNNAGAYNLEVSNFYFGRNLKDCHYSIGRLPLNSANNPIFDLALYAVPTAFTSSGIYAVDIPVSTYNFDRLFGFNYGGKVGDGELNGTLVVLDNFTGDNNAGEGNGLLNDGYALHVSYKNTIGNVTVEPQALISLTNLQAPAARPNSTPYTFGMNATIPSGKSKIGASAFYTVNRDTTPANTKIDYTGYLLRLKGESGAATAWIDYNSTCDQSAANDVDYTNVFVWAQYSFKMHESATGSFSLTPTLRYRASGMETAGTPGTAHNNALRTELYATVTF